MTTPTEHKVGSDEHVMTFGAFWRWITVLVPALLGVSWYLSTFASDYAMLQITNTEDRCTRQDGRISANRRAIELILITQFDRTPEQAAAILNSIE